MKNLFAILFLIPLVLLSNEKGRNMDKKEPKVVGIGGVFFKTENTEKTKKWYINTLHSELKCQKQTN